MIQMLNLGLRNHFYSLLNILDLVGNVCGMIWLLKFKKLCVDSSVEEDCLILRKGSEDFYVYV
jgi:hypothetical protein